MDLEMLLFIAGIVGTIAFAISGALIAIENKLDLFGVIVLAVITACGGGLIRDIMLNTKYHIFSEWYNPLISMVVALIIFTIMYFIKKDNFKETHVYLLTFNIIDSIGLGTFIVVGADASISLGFDSVGHVAFYAVLTAIGGGLLRDVMVGKIPVIFRKHIYAIATIIGALVYYLLYKLNCPDIVTVLTTVILVVVIRYLAYHFKLNLPVVKINEEK